jgi:hypothetical protein
MGWDNVSKSANCSETPAKRPKIGITRYDFISGGGSGQGKDRALNCDPKGMTMAREKGKILPCDVKGFITAFAKAGVKVRLEYELPGGGKISLFPADDTGGETETGNTPEIIL